MSLNSLLAISLTGSREGAMKYYLIVTALSGTIDYTSPSMDTCPHAGLPSAPV